MDSSLWRVWAKSDAAGRPHSLIGHLLDAAAVSALIWDGVFPTFPRSRPAHDRRPRVSGGLPSPGSAKSKPCGSSPRERGSSRRPGRERGMPESSPREGCFLAARAACVPADNRPSKPRPDLKPVAVRYPPATGGQFEIQNRAEPQPGPGRFPCPAPAVMLVRRYLSGGPSYSSRSGSLWCNRTSSPSP